MTTYPSRSAWEIETGALSAGHRSPSEWLAQTLEPVANIPFQIAPRRASRVTLVVKLTSASSGWMLYLANTQTNLPNSADELAEGAYAVISTAGESLTLETQGECWGMVVGGGQNSSASIVVVETYNENIYVSETSDGGLEPSSLPSLIDDREYT
jgi:hypothetical protein